MEAIEVASDLLRGPSMPLGPFSLASSAQPCPLPGTVPARARHAPTLEVLPAVLMSPLSSIDTPPSNLEAYSGHQPLPLLPEVSPDMTPVLFFSPCRWGIKCQTGSAGHQEGGFFLFICLFVCFI